MCPTGVCGDQEYRLGCVLLPTNKAPFLVSHVILFSLSLLWPGLYLSVAPLRWTLAESWGGGLSGDKQEPQMGSLVRGGGCKDIAGLEPSPTPSDSSLKAYPEQKGQWCKHVQIAAPRALIPPAGVHCHPPCRAPPPAPVGTMGRIVLE